MKLVSWDPNAFNFRALVQGKRGSLVWGLIGALTPNKARYPTLSTVCTYGEMDTGYLQVTQIAAGWEHTLALTSEGVLLGWGSNSHGQLGSLKGEQISRAVQIAQGVQQMSAGLRHSAWVTSDGKLRSCGSLDTKNIEIPELLLAKSVACGQRHSMVLIGSDEEEGQVWGWGDNRHGQLGCDPTECVRFSHITLAKKLAHHQFLDLKSGWSHAAAITGSGEVICWGRNTYGQLGKSPTDQNSACVCWPTHYTEDGKPTKAIQLVLGSEHTMVRLDDGSLLTCGWNEHGNCGNGDMQDVHMPQVILKNCTLIGCGSAHSFALINDNFT
ncbi:hypothetical protein B566_EDAN008777 [Ephemera danica]|nr:hypothetical protein B566_EDAN008777 [Ephemera danica]